MAKNSVADWSTTAGNNTDIAGINIAEGCAPSGINNAIRTVMAQVKGYVDGIDVNIQVFTATGTYTPSAGMHHCIVEAVGAGGGGGGAKAASGAGSGGGGGGAGSYSRSVFTAAQIGASKAVTIGAAGAAGTSAPGVGGNGGDTILAGLLTAKGGTGGAVGTTSAAGAPGAGGIAGTGDITAVGTGGGHGFSAAIATVNPFSGAGGSSHFGGGGASRVVNNTGLSAGAAGGNYGAGGGGGCEFNQATGAAGGAGSAGYLVVTEFIG